MKDVVCVTGGSGGIGQALLEQLIDRYQVKALFRTRTALSDRWAARGCTLVWGDMSNRAALAELVRDSRFVFHCAALTQGRHRELYPVNVEGTRTLARLASAHGCRRFVHVSSISVYAASDNGPVYTEALPLAERDEMAVYARTKLQAEFALTEVARAHALDYVILRPTSVYGPNVKTFTLIPISLVTRGLPAIVGAGYGIMDVVYVDDVARAMVLAAETPAAGGQAFNIGHHTVSLNDFYAHFGRMLNRPVRRLPIGVVNGVYRLLRALPARTLAELRQGVRFIGRMAESVDRFPSDKARAVLAYAPQTSLTVGMLKVALWGRRQHLLPASDLSGTAYGAVAFSPHCVVRPETEADLVEVVRLAREEQLSVRAIGALHSQAPIPATDGICIVLDDYNQLLRIDGTAVTVQSGMRLRTLHRALAERGLAMPVSGSIAEQTVAGAVSTATHGGSLHRGALSDYVEAVRMVQADGSVLACDRTQESFHAQVVSLGLLGILSTVTLRCVPAFYLQSKTSVRLAAEVFEDFEAINRDNQFVDMLYFSATDQVEILSINPMPGPVPAANYSGDPGRSGAAAPASVRTGAGLMHRLTLALVRAVAWLMARSEVLQRAVTRSSVGSQYHPRAGRSHEVLAFQDREGAPRTPGVLRDMELAVPFDRAPAALRALRDHFRTSRQFPLLPLHIRCSARSESWLCPAYGQAVCWIEFWQYPPSDEFTERMQALLEPFHYRFHWGKATRSTPAYISRQYERWNDFVALRRASDPHGMFGNEYLNSYFGG